MTEYANGVYASRVHFEWDDSKNLANRRNHGISFEEAIALFKSGVDYLEIIDVDHSVDEDRFIAIARSGGAWSWSSGPNAGKT